MAPASERSLRPYSTTGDYLIAVKEDLAEWFTGLYPDTHMDMDNFFHKLETGVVLCNHINNLIDRLNQPHPLSTSGPTPSKNNLSSTLNCLNFNLDFDKKLSSCSIFDRLIYRTTVQPGSFHARDNLCNYLKWCRLMQMKECLLFETDDLVLRKNEKSVVLCIMEVARIGAKLGLPAPMLIQFEKEIDAAEDLEELQRQNNHTATGRGTSQHDVDDVASSLSSEESLGSCSASDCSGSSTTDRSKNSRNIHPVPYLKNVDQVVKEHVKTCCCQTPFPLTKVAPGKYRVGSTQLVIYVRILRNHVMVRVGGGWDTLDHFLEKHDPCRRGNCHCNNDPSLPMTEPIKPAPISKLRKTSSTTNTDLTPLQVVYRRDYPISSTADQQPLQPLLSPTNNNTVIKIPTTVMTPSSTSLHHAKNTVSLRKISQPSPPTTTSISSANTSRIRLQRARSMDVSNINFEKSQKSSKNTISNPATQVIPRQPRPKTAISNIVSNQSGVIIADNKSKTKMAMQKKRQSVSDYTDVKNLEKNSTSTTAAAEPNKPDPWENAMNRHREKFLNMRDIFESSKSGNNVLVTKTTKEFSDIRLGKGLRSASTIGLDDSAASTPTNGTMEKQPNGDRRQRESPEEGFFSDTSGVSE